ncbi:MAG: iron-only hydrogenase system regulator [Clostridiales bacterium]|nr:iron-only hydrogenase system regulator [Clostridiales bacterium]
MDTRIALLGIFVEDRDSTPRLQELLHEYGEYIVGRMGIPNARKGLSVISIVIDASQDVISALSGKIGMLPGVSVQTMYSKIDK